MAITKPMGLRFPKTDYKIKINGRTKFEATTEVFTLEATGLWDGLVGAQLSHLPARAVDAIGQTIADPTVTVAGNARIVRFKSPDSTEPVVGEVYIDIYSGTILFNTADAGLSVSVTYYIRADLVDHNAMNRIWQAGHTYIVGDEAWADFSDLQSAFSACVDGDSIKLMKDVTTTGTTLTKAIKIEGNNRKITKSGTATNSRAINFNKDLIVRDVEFVGWSAVGDICLYASADVKAIISSNKAINNTKLTNASTVCTYSIVENNLPFSENVGQAVTMVTNNIVDKAIKTFVAQGSISLMDPVFLYKLDPTKVISKPGSGLDDYDTFVGFAMNNASSGGNVDVAFNGFIGGFSGLTPGNTYYINFSGVLTGLPLGSVPYIDRNGAATNPKGTGNSAAMFYEVGTAMTSGILVVKNPRRHSIALFVDQSSTGLQVGTGISGRRALAINTATPTALTYNIFADALFSGAQNFYTGGKSWALDLDLRIEMVNQSTLDIPSLTFILEQTVLGGSTYYPVDSFYHEGYFDNMIFSYYKQSVNARFTNYNPRGGKARIRVVANGASGWTGTWQICISKFNLRFL